MINLLKIIPPFYQPHHYISIAIVAISLYNCYLLFKDAKKDKNYIFITIYITSTIVLFSDLISLTTSIFTVIDNNLNVKVFEAGNTEYSIAELLFFIYFFYNKQGLNIGKRFIHISFIIYTILTIGFIFSIFLSSMSIYNISRLSIFFNVLEFFLLIFMCLTYYYSSIIKPITSNPINNHAFWLVNSLFIYTSTTLPLIIISEDIRTSLPELYHNMFALHFLTIFFVNIIIMHTLSKQKEILL